MKKKRIYYRKDWQKALMKTLEYPENYDFPDNWTEYFQYDLIADHPEYGKGQFLGFNEKAVTDDRLQELLAGVNLTGWTNITLYQYKRYVLPSKHNRFIAEPHRMLIAKYRIEI